MAPEPQAPSEEAEVARSRVVCNPVDLSYRYQDVRFSGTVRGVRISDPRRSVHREAADPSVVRFKGRFFLFASMSRGFWHSEDLVTWEYRPSDSLPAYDYAPDVREIDGALYVCASRKDDPCPFYRSADPLTEDFTEVSPGTFPFWDPNLFQDEDGSVYLYWGCDNATPIKGVALERHSLEPLGEEVGLIGSDVERRGWEQVGEDHVRTPPATEAEELAAQFLGSDPYIEGAWMTRHGDRYYLQYAAPGTEYNTYADGYATADSPLGPFTYSAHSPFSAKYGGFITGAGHGSTFRDEYGNWWHAATMRVSVNDLFERRVGIFPAGFDEDGVLFCDQRFGDYPRVIPEGRVAPWSDPPWMLLSYRARALASSHQDGHGPELAADEDVRTWWAADSREDGQWLALDLGAPKEVHAIQVNVADHRLGEHAPACPDGADGGHTWRGIYAQHQAVELMVEVRGEDGSWHTVHDGRGGEDRPHFLFVLPSPRRVSQVRVTFGRRPFGGHAAISGLRVFGIGGGQPPAPATVHAERLDERHARLEWSADAGAQGHVVRWGAHPEKLYHSWQLYGRQSLDLRALNAGTDYWVAVDSFNDSGVTSGVVVHLPSAR